jgi:hypothetical protein
MDCSIVAGRAPENTQNAPPLRIGVGRHMLWPWKLKVSVPLEATGSARTEMVIGTPNSYGEGVTETASRTGMVWTMKEAEATVGAYVASPV